jgi:DNA polymerase-3 subunit beta
MTNIVVLNQDLNNALAVAGQVILNRPAHPILLDVKLTVLPEDLGVLQIVSTNLKTFIIQSVNLAEPAPSPFEFCIANELFLNIISKLDQGSQTVLKYSEADRKLKISQNGCYTVLCDRAVDFPDTRDVGIKGEPLVFESDAVLPALKSAENHSSDDQTKQTLTAVHLEVREDKNKEQTIYICGTDGHRFSQSTIECNFTGLDFKPKGGTNYSVAVSWNIPNYVIDVLDKVYRKVQKFTEIKISDHHEDDKTYLTIDLGSVSIQTEEVWGVYPDTQGAIRGTSKIRRLFEKSKILNALERLNILNSYLDSKIAIMAVKPDEGEAIFSTVSNKNMGNGEDLVTGTVKDKDLIDQPIAIQFNTKYFIDGIKNLEGFEIDVKVLSLDDKPQMFLLSPIGFNYQHEIGIMVMQK